MPRNGVSNLDYRTIIPYKHVYYDPTTWAEAELVPHLGGMSPHPTYSRYGEEGIKEINNYIKKHVLRPLRKSGGKLNYLNFFR